MNICLKCGKYPFCHNINEKGCEKWVKRSYETKLVKIEDGTYYFEEIK